MTALDTLDRAAALVHAVMPPTPQYCWPLLSRRVGAEIWVKHENHTPIGAFKLRGGLVYLDAVRRAQPQLAGVVTATRGNHGQSIAYAAARLGLAGDDRGAARQQRREKPRDGRVRRASGRGGPRFPGRL